MRVADYCCASLCAITSRYLQMRSFFFFRQMRTYFPLQRPLLRLNLLFRWPPSSNVSSYNGLSAPAPLTSLDNSIRHRESVSRGYQWISSAFARQFFLLAPGKHETVNVNDYGTKRRLEATDGRGATPLWDYFCRRIVSLLLSRVSMRSRRWRRQKKDI